MHCQNNQQNKSEECKSFHKDVDARFLIYPLRISPVAPETVAPLHLLDEPRINNQELGPILKRVLESLKVEEKNMSLVQTNTTFASNPSIELPMLEVSNLGLSISHREVESLHNQSKETQDEDDKYDYVLFTQLRERNLATKGIYTSLDSCYCFKEVDKDELAMEILEEMESKGCRPSICIYNSLIKLHGNQGKVADVMSVL